MLRRLISAMVAASLCGMFAIGPAMAQSTVLSQVPISPLDTTGNGQLLVQSYAVPGGTLYLSLLRPPGTPSAPLSLAQSFVSTSATAPTRYLALTNGKSDSGISLTATPGTPTSAPGVSRTAGTSLALTGTVTSSNAQTNKVIFEFSLPDSYVAGTNIPVVVNCAYGGGGTITAVSTTMTVQFYTVSAAGVETAGTVSAAQQMPATAGNLTFTVTGTGLVPNQRVVVELVMLVTSSAGGNTGVINSVAYAG